MDRPSVCYLFGAGEYYTDSVVTKSSDFIAAVDGGLIWLRERSIVPNLIVGDFDSLSYDSLCSDLQRSASAASNLSYPNSIASDLSYLGLQPLDAQTSDTQTSEERSTNVLPSNMSSTDKVKALSGLYNTDIIALSAKKDDTDMAAALSEAWERGYRVFHIYGGTGGRLDHTLANIQLLANVAVKGGQCYLHDKDTVITAIHNTSMSFPAAASGTLSVFSHSDISTGVYEKGLMYPLTDATLRNTYPLGVSNEFTGLPSTVSVESGTLIILLPGDIEKMR